MTSKNISLDWLANIYGIFTVNIINYIYNRYNRCFEKKVLKKNTTIGMSDEKSHNYL